jgi:outer membrane receptor protein involved in Fe transport
MSEQVHAARRLSTSMLLGGIVGCVAILGLQTPAKLAAAQTDGQSAPQAGAESDATQPSGPARDVKSILDLSLDQLAAQPVRLADPIITTVSQVNERVSESPGSVYVFTRQMIQERGYRSLRELLQVVPGFTVFHRDLEYVAGVRGLNANDNEKITLLINSQELNGIFEPNFLNGPINLDNVERVEVVVGPSSFFQRGNTLAATINVITRDPDGPEAVVAAGSALPGSATYMTGHKWAADDFVSFSFTTEQKTGFDAWRAGFRPNLAGRCLTGALEEPSFFSVLKRQYGEWTFQATAYRSVCPELLIDNGDPRNNGVLTDQFYSLFLKNEHPLSDTLTRVFKTDATYKQLSRLSEDGSIVPNSGIELSAAQMDYSLDWGYRYTGINRHLIQAGVQADYFQNFGCFFDYVQMDNQQQVTRVYEGTPLVVRDNQYFGFYLDDEFQVNEKLKLVGGVREDCNSELPGDHLYTGARAAIIYQMTEHWVTKALYNRAVRMPSIIASLDDSWGKGKPDAPDFARLAPTAFAPEILSTVELQNIFYIEKAKLGITVYHEELDDFISWYEPWTNVGNFSGTGVEMNFQRPLGQRTNVWGNFSFIDSHLVPFEQYKGGGPSEQQHVMINPEGRIIGTPLCTANLGVDRKLTDHFSLSPTLRYFTEQAAFDDGAKTFATVRNQFYFDASLTWKDFCGEGRDLRLSGYNLCNNRNLVGGQWLAGMYRPEGITGVLSLYWRF